MPSIETYRKHAKLLLRWHRERNYSIGGKVRLLERYRHLTDVEVLEMPVHTKNSVLLETIDVAGFGG